MKTWDSSGAEEAEAAGEEPASPHTGPGWLRMLLTSFLHVWEAQGWLASGLWGRLPSASRQAGASGRWWHAAPRAHRGGVTVAATSGALQRLEAVALFGNWFDGFSLREGLTATKMARGLEGPDRVPGGGVGTGWQRDRGTEPAALAPLC